MNKLFVVQFNMVSGENILTLAVEDVENGVTPLNIP